MLKDGKVKPSTKHSSVMNLALHYMVLLVKTKEMFQTPSAVPKRLLTVLSPSDKSCLFLLTGRCNIITVLKSYCGTRIQSSV